VARQGLIGGRALAGAIRYAPGPSSPGPMAGSPKGSTVKKLEVGVLVALSALAMSGCEKVNELMGKKETAAVDPASIPTPVPPAPSPTPAPPAPSPAPAAAASCASLESCCGAVAKSPGAAGLAAPCAGIAQLKSMGAAGEAACSQTLTSLRPGLSALPGGPPAECSGSAGAGGALAGTAATPAPAAAQHEPAAPPPPPAHGQKRKKGR
jgi:hypothetical protein